MGFFDTYEDTSGLSWVKKEEKEQLIEDETPLAVISVFKSVTQFGPRYVMTFDLDGETRALSFGAVEPGKEGGVESRDNLFEAMIAYAEENDGSIDATVKLVRKGRAILVVAADGE